jgi:hypothetical protein
MNYTRIVLAAVAAFIVDALYGFVVYGNVLTSEFARFPGVFRPMATQGAYMPILFCGILLAMLVAAFIYAKGYEGGSGMVEGARFGLLIGLVTAGYGPIVNYAIENIGRRLSLSMAVATVAEWILAGLVIGIVNKPAAAPARARAAV